MTKPVIAIGLDSADPQVIENWMDQGYLKNLNQIRQQGIYQRLNNVVEYQGEAGEIATTEEVWVMVLTGCLPSTTGYWGACKYNSETYNIFHDHRRNEANNQLHPPLYDAQQFPPFYGLGNPYRVGIFDVPCAYLSEAVNGLQVLAWGGHFPHTSSHSLPEELYAEIQQKYGENPVLYKDYKYWWDRKYIQRMQADVSKSIATRTAICQDFLQREPWDLFMTVFGETHTASHDFWLFSQSDHPLYPYFRRSDQFDPMLNAFEEVDQAIGKIIEAAPDDASIVVFSAHGMVSNGNDLYSMVFLPELLYRFSFPGKVALGYAKSDSQIPPIIHNPRRNTWAGEIWQRKYYSNPLKRFLYPWLPGKFLHAGPNEDLISPYELHEQSAPLNWMPILWYRPSWPKMKAFALPNFSDGLIRINLQEREKYGIVPATEYDALCDQLTILVSGLKDARTGEPLVQKVIRTRTTGYEVGNQYPDADLIVVWRAKPTDVAESPEFGRMGPFPYYRTGGHRSQGFICAKGPKAFPNQGSGEGRAIDLAPTILNLMEVAIPDHFDGKSLF